MLAWDNYDSNDYTYNEEYSYTVPEAPAEPPTYFLSSDSENDPCPDDYSSSGSSDYEDEEYFDKFSRRAEPNFLDVERVDDEADLIIPLETDDTDFGGLQTDRNGRMICTICSLIFKSKIRYGIHQRRHFAVDHFKCPVCSKGFNKLSQCQAHELVEHNNNRETSSGNGSSPNSSEKRDYTFRTRNARKTHHFNEALDFNEADLTLIVPSTSLYPYRGPEVVGVYKSYEIEVKYGRPERKSHSRLQSKYILESQKRLKKKLELKEAQLELAEKKKVERALRRAKRRAETNGTVDGEEELAVKVPTPVEKCNHIARARPAHQRQSIFLPSESNSGPKCYFCSICGFSSEDETGIHTHQELVHPDISVSELLNFFFIDKSLREKKEKPLPKPDEVTPPKRGRVGRPRKVRTNKSSHNSYLSPSKVLKHERRKEARLFRPRKHVPRVWEKPFSMPHTEEFIFGIGLIRKTDVLLGPRKRQSLISSSLLRRRRRDVSPVSPTKKSIRIQLERLSTKNKRFYLCDHCEYHAQSKTEVRRHRRNEHLKNLRAVPPEGSATKPKPVPVVEVPRKKHKKKKNGVFHTSGSSSSSTSRTTSQGHSNSYRNSDPGPSNSFRNSAPGPSTSRSSNMNQFSCTQCDFRGLSQIELERHSQRRHNVEVLTCDIPREVIDRMLGIYNGTFTPASSRATSPAGSSRSSSPPPRKKTKV